MGAYSQFIHADRRAVSVPKDLVDASGRCVFGTFDREFETMELLSARKPTRAPHALNRLKLTLWEAAEIHLEQGVLLAAVCDMGFFGKILHVFYDKPDFYSFAVKINTINAQKTRNLNISGFFVIFYLRYALFML